MQFPNALRGIKIIHTAELVTLLLTLVSLLSVVLKPFFVHVADWLSAFYGAVLFLSILALVLELLGICVAGRDEPLFRTASLGMVFTLALSFGVLFFEEGDLLRTFMELLCIIPTIYCSVTVIKGILRIAKKLDHQPLLARGRFLVSAVFLLSLGAMVLEFASAFLLNGEANEPLHTLVHAVVLLFELTEVSLFLCCTSQAEKMLHSASSCYTELP